jgi:predicted nucleic acid-binding protein
LPLLSESSRLRAPRCTIDSSCVIALDHLDLLPQLSLLFSRVLVPKAVREDLYKRRATKDRLQFLFDSYAFLERCDGYEKGTVDFLLAERVRQGMRDRGEVEAVVQASEFGASVIVDDQWGRKLATQYDLDHHGTFWVLQRFYDLGLRSAPALRISLASLRARRTRLPWKTVNAWLVQIGETPL